jgi:hypothetical protein
VVWWPGLVGRCGEAGEGSFPPAFPCSGREASGGAALVIGLAGVPGGEDALVADGVQAGDLHITGLVAHPRTLSHRGGSPRFTDP